MDPGDRQATKYDSGPAIAASRKYVLAIVGLAALALQIGWMESARQERLTLFAYFDKTLTLYELITVSLSSTEHPLIVQRTSLGPDDAPIAMLGAGENNPMALACLALASGSGEWFVGMLYSIWAVCCFVIKI